MASTVRRNIQSNVRPVFYEGAAAAETFPDYTFSGPKPRTCGSLSQPFRPLEIEPDLPKSFAAGRLAWARCGRRRMSDALLRTMLLNGGCGYEDLRLLSPLAVDRRF
jgi:hypothetical protein